MKLDTRAIPAYHVDEAVKCWKAGDIKGVLIMMPNTACLAFVCDNWKQLKDIGKYEEALLSAYVGTRVNHSLYSMDLLMFLFKIADHEKLRKAGEPVPEQAEFTLYRGVSGVGRKRRVTSFSWTESVDIAAWFAKRFVDLPDPAVFKVVVPNEQVMAYCNEREEKECLLRLPLPVKPKRVKELPEILPEKI